MVQEIEITLRTRVVIIEDTDGHWFARGLDVDYAAQGRSHLEVQKAFEIGFVATVREHFAAYGHLDYFTRPAPDDVMQKYEQTLHEHATSALLPLDEQDGTSIARLEFYEAA